jgi:hypothetical protein
MNLRIFRARKGSRCLGNLIENRLQPHMRPRQLLKDARNRLMAITKVGQLTDQLGDPGIA